MMADRILGYREQQILQLMASDLAEQGRVRSYRQIAEALGMRGRSGVCNVVSRLERRGLVHRVGCGANWRVALSSRELPSRIAAE